MKIIVLILIVTSSLAFNTDDRRLSSRRGIIRSTDNLSTKSKKHQLQIERETGLDGKVRAIRLDKSEEIPGVRVYGIPKNKAIDSRKIEKSEPKPVHRGDPRSGRVSNTLEKKKNLTEDGQIERISMKRQENAPVNIVHVSKRSVKDPEKLDDLEVAEGKVFRPLFVYRQQVNRRNKAQKKKGYPKKYDPRTRKPRPIYRYPNRGGIY